MPFPSIILYSSNIAHCLHVCLYSSKYDTTLGGGAEATKTLQQRYFDIKLLKTFNNLFLC